MHAGFASDLLEKRELSIVDTAILLTVRQGVPSGARKLIWQEFFASRSRGINWSTHFPWTETGTALCSSAAVNGEVVAALLVHCAPASTTAMIGCVCVDSGFRGLSLSLQLVDLAALVLQRLGVGRMLLWTSKPGVYKRAGFVVVAQERQLALHGDGTRLRTPATLSLWPDDDVSAGLPPFATAGWQATLPTARIIFVDTPLGTALLDHTGAPEEVMSLMFAVRPGAWSAALNIDDPLRHHIIADGACSADDPGSVTMVRLLDDTTLPAYVPPAFRI